MALRRKLVLTLRVPRESDNTPEQTAQLLASLAKATRSPDLLGRLYNDKGIYISLEVTLINGQIIFSIVYPEQLSSFVQSQMLATYSDVVMSESRDYLTQWIDPFTKKPNPAIYTAVIRQAHAPYFPLRDYADYKEVDPMLPTLGVLSKANKDAKVLVQYVLTPAPASFTKNAHTYLHPKSKTDEHGRIIRPEQPESRKIIEDKLSHPLVGVSIHFASNQPDIIHDLKGAISVLNRPDGNSLVPAVVHPWRRKKLQEAILHRQPFTTFTVPLTVLNVMELSSLWHLPGVYTKIPNVAWSASSSFSEAPENLPVFTKDVPKDDPEINDRINFFASTVYRNHPSTFGIKMDDRLRHFYILGKSGTGKSTLLENMAVDDFKKGRGVAFIDPHGDSAENLLNFIPKHRINDVVYFDPADKSHPISINILEVNNPDQAELVASGIIAIFHKLYGHSWGPRLEYILRNTVLTLTQVPGSTLPDVVRMLTQKDFRLKVYKMKNINPQLLSFWQNEYDKLDEKTRTDQISSILNKVGQFVNSPLIHNLISHRKSTVDLVDVINSGKILIANLSQGRLGEDNSALLGAMFITKLQLAAMSRVDKSHASRKEFFLYVDEFQNFATESFIKILSEARKYRLGLILANQYIAQIPEPIQKAIFGNAGTVACFVLGSEDARVMEAEFGGAFTASNLVALQKYQIALRLTIDGAVSAPFLATTLPPHKSYNQNREKVLLSSRQRYSIKS